MAVQPVPDKILRPLAFKQGQGDFSSGHGFVPTSRTHVTKQAGCEFSHVLAQSVSPKHNNQFFFAQACVNMMPNGLIRK